MTQSVEPELTLRGGVAMGRQLQTQIRDLIVLGRLHPGEQLPTVRAVAAELAVNPAVVERAYQELEREGILTSEEGSGTFVAAQTFVQRERVDQRWMFDELCSEFLAQAARQGFSSEDVVAQINLLGNLKSLS